MSRLMLLALALPALASANNGRSPNAGGVPQCQTDLQVCTEELSTCYDELDASAVYWQDWCEEQIAGIDCSDPVASTTFGGSTWSEDGRAFVTVPPGAVAEAAALTITRVEQPAVEVERASDVYDFGPDGLTFGKPATICLASDTSRLDASCLGYLDETRSPPEWKCEDSCLDETDNNTLCGETDHFTNFAILLTGTGSGKGCDRDDDYITSWKTGGVVTAPDGAAFVSLPPGALSEDKALAVKPVSRPVVDAPRLTGVYDFGPGAMSFNTQVSICFKLQTDQVDDLCLAYIDESVSPPKWRCEDSCLEQVGRDQVCGKTDHFTNFAILLGGRGDGGGDLCSSAL
jgi:hypothetical protein